MLRQFYTSVLERRKSFSGPVETPPFEAGWASEAIFFVRVDDIVAGSSVALRVQISPDGMHWVDEGTIFELLDKPGDAFVKVSHFGGWLRLAGTTSPSGDTVNSGATLTIHLALKG